MPADIQTASLKALADASAKEVVNLDNVEIFRSGDYGNRGVYTDQVLAEIAASYDPKKHEAPATIDHEAKGPAYGWVSAVRAESGKLFADFRQVPAAFRDLIQAGRFKKRSVEMLFDKATKKPSLYRVTFLGANIPEIGGMKDIYDFSKDGAEEKTALFEFCETDSESALSRFFGRIESGLEAIAARFSAKATGAGASDSAATPQTTTETETPSQIKEPVMAEEKKAEKDTHAMTAEARANFAAADESAAKLAKFEADLAAANAARKIAEDKLEASLKTERDARLAIEAKLFASEESSRLAAFCADNKLRLVPAVRSRLEVLFHSLPADADCIVKFDDGKGGVTQLGARAALLDLVKAIPENKSLRTEMTADMRPAPGDASIVDFSADDNGEAMDKAIKKYQAEHKGEDGKPCSYKAAFAAIHSMAQEA